MQDRYPTRIKSTLRKTLTFNGPWRPAPVRQKHVAGSGPHSLAASRSRWASGRRLQLASHETPLGAARDSCAARTTGSLAVKRGASPPALRGLGAGEKRSGFGAQVGAWGNRAGERTLLGPTTSPGQEQSGHKARDRSTADFEKDKTLRCFPTRPSYSSPRKLNPLHPLCSSSVLQRPTEGKDNGKKPKASPQPL